MRRILIIAVILLIPIVPIVLVVTGVLGTKPQTVKHMELTVWGTEDEVAAFKTLFPKYNAARPYVRMTYTKVRSEDYVDQLVRAWATGSGPDVFFVPNTWVGQMEQYALPMPASLTVPQVLKGKGLFGDATEVSSPAVAAPSVATLRGQYVDGVLGDIVRDGKVWGLPLAIDTVAVYYNKDLLNNAQVFAPAKTWTELLQQIDTNRLTATDEADTIVRAAIGLGTADNVPYSADILSLLLMQNGVPEVTTGGRTNLRDAKAQTAFEFFLSFSDAKKVSYSWNIAQPNAREAFLAGKVAYYIGTYQDRQAVAASSLNWGVSPMFHLASDGDNDAATGQRRFINLARYQVPMVSKASELSQRSAQAWNLVYYMSRDRNVPLYLNATGRLAALQSLLANQKDRPDYQVFATQMLTAKSWYRGRDGANVERQLREMITSVVTNQSDVADALRLANDQLNAAL